MAIRSAVSNAARAGLSSVAAASGGGSPRERSTPSHGHSGGAPSSCEQVPRATWKPWPAAACSRSVSSQVLPIPGSPTRTAQVGVPAAADARWACSAARSVSRPTADVDAGPPAGLAAAGVGPGAATAASRVRSSPASCCRIARSSSRSSTPGSSPSSSASSSRTARRLSSASAWRPERVRARACSAHHRSCSGLAVIARLRGRQRARVLAERQQPQQPGLLADHPRLLKRGALGHHVRVVLEIGVRLAAPRGEGRVEVLERGGHGGPVGPSGGVAGRELGGQRRQGALEPAYVGDEAVGVDVVGGDPEHVAVVGRLEHRRRGPRGALGLEDLAQPGDVGVQGAVGGPRRLARPDQVGQRVGGDRAGRRAAPGPRRSSGACGRRGPATRARRRPPPAPPARPPARSPARPPM